MNNVEPVAGPSRRHRHNPEGRRSRIPPLLDGCVMGPEFIYDSEGQPQLFAPDPALLQQDSNERRSRERARESEDEYGEDCDHHCRSRERQATTASDDTAVSLSAPQPHPTPRTPFKHIDRTPTHLQTTPAGRIIWVDFPAGDPANPLCFTKGKKLAIVGVAVYFTGITAYATSSYSIGLPSMCAELGCGRIQGAAGLSLYAWGFGIAPLVLAPLSEEYGRKWSYIIAVVVFTVLHLMMTLGKNTGTILVGRFLIGAAGSLGATLVGGTISDIYPPEERGFPMALFALMAMFFTGLGPVMMSWVEIRPDLGWRWIQWIEMIMTGVYIPLVIYILRETRGPVLIRRRALKMRKELAKQRLAGATSSNGEVDREKLEEEDEYEYRYTARAEVGKVKFAAAIRTSLLRPLLFLVFEPVVTFFSVWVSLAWGVFYTQIQGLPYIYPRIYGFSTTQTGLIYITMCIGSLTGFGFNFLQDAIYRRKVAKHGVEARLYAPMAGGVALFVGCMIFAFTVRPDVHWMGPAVAIVIIIASVITLYISGFVYLSECYGSYASSAIAAMSFLRNMFGGAFALFTEDMYDTLTPRWAIFLMGMVAGVLGIVPFIAYWKGPEIRARSPFSRILMAEEKARVAAADKEKAEQEMSSLSDQEAGLAAMPSRSGQGRQAGSRGNEGDGTAQGREWDEQIRETGEAQIGFERGSSRQ